MTAILPRFFRRLHLELVTQLAERLRRREVIIATSAAPASQSAAPSSCSRPCPLPPERQLNPNDLRRLEVARRSAAPPPAPAAAPPPAQSTAPSSGEHRRRWLRSRLEQVLRDHTEVCAESEAVPALHLLALFETLTAESFADTPGTLLPSRVCGFGKVLGNITKEVSFVPALQQFSRRGRAYWNRRPRDPLDVLAWKARVVEAEKFAAPGVRLRDQRIASNAGLAEWLRGHRYLVPAELEAGSASASRPTWRTLPS